VNNEPLYPFGYGLSYSKFEYSDLKLSDTILKGNKKLMVSVNVKNLSKVAGKEVVQLYIRDLVGSITRPVKELKGFDKVEIAAGETKKIVFEITPELLKFYNSYLKYDWESGEFMVMVGPNSNALQSKKIKWMK
jgi:beta-glucosidase